MSVREEALALHKEKVGKLEVCSKVSVENAYDLSLAYTPGVAEPCKEIVKNPDDVYTYTTKGNMVAVVTDGTAVLGLGNIGPEAALPVMEGKAVLFKRFGNIDAIPICLATTDADEIVKTVSYLAPSLGGINLEDIAAPKCFEIERKLKAALDIPVFHDDQHGTAIVVLAALINALRLTYKELSSVKIVINGAGSAGIAIAKLLLDAGATNLILVDRLGAVCKGEAWLNDAQEIMAQVTNKEEIRGSLIEAISGADVFVGVSVAGALKGEMVQKMAENAIVFAMANPDPEILPEQAIAAGAAIVGTGRSDFPNQINNVLAFPGIFRGALDVRATEINEAMKVAAAKAIANILEVEELHAGYIIPLATDSRVAQVVARAVAQAAIESNVAKRINNK